MSLLMNGLQFVFETGVPLYLLVQEANEWINNFVSHFKDAISTLFHCFEQGDVWE